jgi:hypothetical protein
VSPPTCLEVRAYLASVGAHAPHPVDPGTWKELLSKGAVAGTSEAPTLTPVGQHVLSELEVRAYRTDALTLDFVADQLSRVLGDMEGVAKTAEYFLAELGPVTPGEALPLLRPVAIELANLRGRPEELAEQFRNVWGGVEVMGGNPRDRLLAAALLHAAGAPMDKIYSPMMTTITSVREVAGPRAPAVTVAALLELGAGLEGKPRLEAYLALRSTTRTEEGAAMLAATGQPVEAIRATRAALLARLAQGRRPTGDDQVAAGYLAVCGADIDRHLPRVETLTKSLGDRFPNPIVAASVLSMADWLSPAELINWLDKAYQIAHSRQLAPTRRELSTLGLALVLGLPPSEFATTDRTRPLLTRLADLVAVNAWVYGELIPLGPASGPVPAG